MRRLWLAVLLVGLAGCEAIIDEIERFQEELPVVEREPMAPEPQPEPEPEPEIAVEEEVPPAEEQAAALPAAPAAAPPPRPESKPAVGDLPDGHFIGLTPRQTERLLGPPDMRSEDPPATVWTYLQGPCRLEIFFYFDLESQQKRSLALDLHPGSTAKGAHGACLVELVRRGDQHRPLDPMLNDVGVPEVEAPDAPAIPRAIADTAAAEQEDPNLDE